MKYNTSFISFKEVQAVFSLSLSLFHEIIDMQHNAVSKKPPQMIHNPTEIFLPSEFSQIAYFASFLPQSNRYFPLLTLTR